MSLNKSHFLENALCRSVFLNTSYAVATPYLALYTTAPDKTGGGVEVSTSGTAYVREALAIVTSSGNPVYSPLDATGSTWSFATVAFPVATGGGFGTVVAVGIFDAVSSGNMLYYAAISPVVVSGGIQFEFTSGNLTVREG